VKPLDQDADGVRMGNGERGTSETAFALLARQLEREQDRVERAERRLEEERRLLEAERQRSAELRTALADAVAAERIAAGDAVGLRAEVERLIAESRLPWWQRWFSWMRATAAPR
jgi:hypothetical protein